jgi:hypothetical protein
MENIDVPSTLALFGFILIVIGFAATFFKKTKTLPHDAAEQAPYKIETPVAPVAPPIVEIDQTAVVSAKEASAVKTRARKPVAKKPATKRAPAKKTAKKKPASE